MRRRTLAAPLVESRVPPEVEEEAEEIAARTGEAERRRLLTTVPVHTDTAADRDARSIGAVAFALRGEIYFADGAFDAGTVEGRGVLGHELAHVVQQRRDPDLWELTLPRQEGAAPAAPPTATERLRTAVDQLDTIALPRLRQAIDGLDAAAVDLAVPSVAALWMATEAARGALHPAPPPTQPPQPPPTGPTAAGPVTAVPAAVSAEELAELDRRYESARVKVWRAVSTQYFRGKAVREEAKPPAPDPVGFPGAVMVAGQGVSWTIRDATALSTLVAKPSLDEGEQWKAVGLLRQHLSPWDFAFTLAVLEASGAKAPFAAFLPGPKKALADLSATVAALVAEGKVAPGQEVGGFELRPMEGDIRLVQPMSTDEVAEQLYGRGSDGVLTLRSFNRAIAQQDPRSWLPRGTVLVVYAQRLVAPFQQVYAYAQQMTTSRNKMSGEPYIWLEDEGPLAVGNTLTFGVAIGNAFFAPTQLAWWVENDPVAVRENGVAQRVDLGTGTLAMLNEQTVNAKQTARAVAPGNHWLTCKLTSQDGSTQTVSRMVTVLKLQDKLDIEASRQLRWYGTPTKMLADLEAERDKAPAGSDARKKLDERLVAMRKSLGEADAESRRYLGHDAHLHGIRATYVSADERALAVPLTIFVGSDPGYFDATDHVLKLWDFTLSDRPAQYGGRAERPQEALLDLLGTFARKAPYPKGAIRFDLTSASLPTSGMRAEVVTYATDGGESYASVLRGLSMVAMGVGVVSAALLQAEIALPAFAIAGALAGAGGAVNIYERLDRGQFDWDLQTGIDLLDIAGAVLTLGATSAATSTVKGVGRLSIGGKMQLGIGTVQLGVMAGIHVEAIAKAVAKGDRDQVARELLSALADGALILIVHRASARLANRPGVTQAEPLPYVDQPRPTETVTKPTAPPGTPEYHRQTHEAWAGQTKGSGLAPRKAVATQGPVEPRDDFPDVGRAQAVYEDLMLRNPDREVGVYRNTETGAYAVRQGTAAEVHAPQGGHWEPVMHFHPNPGNTLTHRMPAPRDVHGTSVRAKRAGHAITEFIDFPTPDGRVGKAAYTAHPDGRVEIEFQRADGTRVQRSFADIDAYQTAYGSRTTYLDPASPEYAWVVADLHEMYGRPPGSAPSEGTQTAKGVVAPTGAAATTLKPPDFVALRQEHAATLTRRPVLAAELAALEKQLAAGQPKASVLAQAAELDQRVRQLAAYDAQSAVPPKSRLLEVSLDKSSPHYWEKVADLVPDPPVVVEFPDGTKVWRDTKGGPIRHESVLGSSLGRAGMERAFYATGEHGNLPAGPRYQRAHTLGQGTGFESPYALLYAPERVNQTLQNNGIEAYLRTLNGAARPGEVFQVRTSTTPHERTRRLSSITYDVVLLVNGKAVDIASYRIDVSASAAHPVVSSPALTYAANPTAAAVAARGGLPVVLAAPTSYQY